MIGKRILDAVCSGLLLIVFSPVLAACAIAIKLNSRGPVFFRQARLGYQGKIFKVIKFRTMIPDAVKVGTGLTTFQGDPRITRVGHLLRNYRLDELPQLFNVLVGQMSLVGPRPLLPEFLPGYGERDKKRMLMPPGMTGWQQVNGASNNSWEERIDLDVWYVEHWSLWLDLKILLKTVLVVIKPDSVYGKDGQQLSGVPTALLDRHAAGAAEGETDESCDCCHASR